MTAPLLLVLLSIWSVVVSSQKLHPYPTYKSSHQTILVIGETGAGKSTFIQYMNASEVSDIDQARIAAGARIVTRNSSVLESNAICIGDTCTSATYYDTAGFNAEEVGAAKWYSELHDSVRLREQIHKVMIVQRVGRVRSAMVAETKAIIELLQMYGAARHNVYITLTFAHDYDKTTRDRLKKEVIALYADHVEPTNIFYSYYALLSEIESDARPHYWQKIERTHLAILDIVLRKVEPFHPVMETFKRCKEAISHCPNSNTVREPTAPMTTTNSSTGMYSTGNAHRPSTAVFTSQVLPSVFFFVFSKSGCSCRLSIQR